MLLLLKNHSIKIVGLITEHLFINIICRFFERYVFKEESSRLIKDWLFFETKKNC